MRIILITGNTTIGARLALLASCIDRTSTAPISHEEFAFEFNKKAIKLAEEQAKKHEIPKIDLRVLEIPKMQYSEIRGHRGVIPNNYRAKHNARNSNYRRR